MRTKLLSLVKWLTMETTIVTYKTEYEQIL